MTIRAFAAMCMCVGVAGCGNDETIAPRDLINVSGVVVDVTAGMNPVPQPVTVGVLDAVENLNGSIALITAKNTFQSGLFTLVDVDVTDQPALVLYTDDVASGTYVYDGITARGGDYFPMITGAATYVATATVPAADRADLSDAYPMAVPNSVVQTWSTLPGLADMQTTGFAVGLVLDAATQQPIAGATVASMKPGTTLSIVYVPDDTTPLTATGTTGMFVTNDIALRDPTFVRASLGDFDVNATVSGYTCTGMPAIVSANTGYMVYVLCTAL